MDRMPRQYAQFLDTTESYVSAKPKRLYQPLNKTHDNSSRRFTNINETGDVKQSDYYQKKYKSFL